MYELNDMITREAVASNVRSHLEMHADDGWIRDCAVRVEPTADMTDLVFYVSVVEGNSPRSFTLTPQDIR